MSDYKRYMVIKYDHYYPSGGIEDCRESFDTLEEALSKCGLKGKEAQIDYSTYVFDRIDGKIIYPND